MESMSISHLHAKPKSHVNETPDNKMHLGFDHSVTPPPATTRYPLIHPGSDHQLTGRGIPRFVYVKDAYYATFQPGV